MAPSQTFIDHVHELRKRAIYVAIALLVFSTVGYVYRLQITSFLQKPLGAPLYFSNPAGSFNFVVQISMIIGLMVTVPVIVYQFVRFIEPALPVRLKRLTIIKVMLASSTLALIGAAFGFYILVPSSLKFFLGFSTEEIKPLISANEYLRYVTNILLAFAIIFQIPLITLFINRITPLKPSKLLKYQRHVIVAALAIALILPFTYDPMTMFIIALPMVVLFYMSVILLWIVNRKREYPTEDTRQVIDLEPEPKPDAAPALKLPESAPRPALPAIATVTKPRPLAMDGFIAMPRPAVAATAIKSKSISSNKVPSRPRAAQARPRFAIDGISKPLASSL